MSDPFSTVVAELPRDRWGRPLIAPPEGGAPVAYTRVTTFVKALEDTYHLGEWFKRMVALGMARSTHLVLAATAITDPKDPSQKKTLMGIAKSAMEAAGGGARATIGTALHSFSERVDRGEDYTDVPDEFLADLVAYAKVIEPFTIVDIEGFCVRDDLQVGGTYDRILGMPADGLEAPDGTLVTGSVIGDLKTGDNVSLGMGAIAQQLGVYANSLSYEHTLGARSELPGGPINKSWGIVIHLPAGTGRAELLWVNIAAGWETARTITPAVHAWRKRKDLSYPLASASVELPKPTPLPEQIRAAASYDALLAIYQENSTRWTPGLTSLAAERRAELSAA